VVAVAVDCGTLISIISIHDVAQRRTGTWRKTR
jgi:hypothetical protein